MMLHDSKLLSSESKEIKKHLTQTMESLYTKFKNILNVKKMNSELPFVPVLMSTFNSEKTLERAIIVF